MEKNIVDNAKEKYIELLENDRELSVKYCEVLEKKNKLEIENLQLKDEKKKIFKKYNKSLKENEELERVLKQKENDYQQVLARLVMTHKSTSWRITKPIRGIGILARRVLGISIFRKIRTALSICKTGGIRQLLYTIKHYKEIKASQRINESEGVEIDSEYQDNIDFTGKQTDIKMLAFHLPQYHTFPENDKWWGKGFTEWTNVKKGDSRFEGHYQPRVPHSDIGYYDLSNVECLEKQINLAKQHGIYGFCFYYYWFSGKRLMEKPVDILLEHKEIEFPFCLCWANENWTRAWDGQNKDVLIAQKYSDEDDDNFILDMRKYIEDSRYIRINGKPLIVVYNPGQIPDCSKSFKRWREVAKEVGIGEILIWTCQTANNTADKLGIVNSIDAEVEFPPHNYWHDSLAVRNVDLRGKSAFLYSYSRLVEEIVQKVKATKKNKTPLHYCCMMGWDNAARRKDAWFTYTGFSLKSFYKWMVTIFEKTREVYPQEERFVFINAWNEWGEGTYLEPDEKYGYANINTVSKALFEEPLIDDLLIINSQISEGNNSEKFKENDAVRIAVQIHMFYTDVLDETIEYLNNIPYKFDCFVSTDKKEKKRYIEKVLEEKCNCENYTVEIFENIGRDVAPFIEQMTNRIQKYDYLCHIHSKKTKTGEHGNEWRKYIFRHLLGGREYLKKLFDIFEEDNNIGILMPETYPVLELQAEWGGNKEGTRRLLRSMGIEIDLPMSPVFPVGNMFWMRTDAVKDIFEFGIDSDDFDLELGQTNLTLGHQIERAWIYIAKHNGYGYKKVFNNVVEECVLPKKNRIMVYVHYDKDNEIKTSDVKTLEIYKKICKKILFVSNSNLTAQQIDRVKNIVDEAVIRDNKGFDFGAWKCILLENREEIKRADELILLNNSCFEPIFDIKEMFSKMENSENDFWGNTIFPYTPDGTYIGKKYIDEHIQSYFMVFNHEVINSRVFWSFWEELPECEEFIDVVANCESRFTKVLADEGYVYEPYIKESYYMSRYLNNYAIPYEKPVSLVLLRNPFLKKKCYQYMDEVERVKLESLLKRL